MCVGRPALIVMWLATAPGCLVASLHPAYDERSVAFDERLLGRWRNEDQRLDLEIERGEWKSYQVTVRTGRETMTASGHLTHLGERALIDVMPSSGADPEPLLLPVHGIYLVEFENGDLSVAALDYDELRKRVEAGVARVRASLDERQNIVVTARTPALREWLALGARGAPFAAPVVFKRIQAD